MNDNGQLGSQLYSLGSLSVSAAANALLLEKGNGGVLFTNAPTNGAIFNLPAGPYADYHVYIGLGSATSLGAHGEYVLRATGFNGVARRTDHSVNCIGSGETDIIMRANEIVHLRWSGSVWTVLSFTPYMFSGAGWMETMAGEVDMDFTFSDATVIPVGENLTYDVGLPVKLAGGAYTFMACDRNATTPVALGLATNASQDTSDITFRHTATSGITDKARFTVFNNTGSAVSGIGTVYYHGNGVLDYADLGGIASY